MVGLLDLPSELLFEIISLVLSSPPELRQNEKRYRQNWTASTRNRYCMPPLELLKTPTALSLLLLNRRLYTETREYLAKAPQIFHFEIAIVDDHWIFPTPRLVPPRKPGEVIHRLNIDVVPCCTEEKRHLQTSWEPWELDATEDLFGDSSLSFTGHCIANELTTPLVEYLIDRYFKFPWLMDIFDSPSCQNDDTTRLPITQIDTIAIRICTSRYKTGNEVLSKEEVPFRTISGLAHLDFERLYPLDFAKSKVYFDEVRRAVDEGTSIYDASKVAKRAGRIQFYLDGDMWQEVDLGQRAREL